MQGVPIEAMPGHRRGGRTRQTGPRRRNPKGSRGLRPINHCRFLDWNGSVAVQSLMGPRGMVVPFNVFTEQTVQVPFTEHDDVIEQFPA